MEQIEIWTDDEARRYVSAPLVEDDKYSRGVLGVIAGSSEYPGASVLVCEAAAHTGVGMLRYLGPSSATNLVLHRRPEVVTRDGQVQAWTIGSGTDPTRLGWARKKVMKAKLRQGLPTVLDAGGLTLIRDITGPTLITPHFRELAGLLSSAGLQVSADEVKADPQQWARIACESFAVTVLVKGNISYVVSKDRQITLPAASSWLATAGTGDVLAGILGALFATQSRRILEQPDSLIAIAATGSLIHAKAAHLASAGGPVTALGVAHAISQVVSDLLHIG